MIANGSRESSCTDSIAHDMDPFTEPGLNAKNIKRKVKTQIDKPRSTTEERAISKRISGRIF